jgi:hypothetical protein
MFPPTGPDACLVAFRPALVLRDPELIKEILVKEFNTFFDRNAQTSHHKDPLAQNLFLLKGELWRHLRMKMSPIFTSFRIKQMFPLINTCGKQLVQYIARSDMQLEAKEAAGKYATDVIATCAFGIESNSLSNPSAEFREFGRKIFDYSVYRSFEFMSAFMLPFVVKLMGITFFSNETTQFMRRAFWETIKQREEKNIERQDFMQLLIKLKNGEDLSISNSPDTPSERNGAVKDSKLIRKFSSYSYSNIPDCIVLTAVLLNSCCVFSDITPCSPSIANGQYGVISQSIEVFEILYGDFSFKHGPRKVAVYLVVTPSSPVHSYEPIVTKCVSRLDVEPGVHDQMLLAVRQLRSCTCEAPFVTRGRVCHLSES